MYIELFFQIMTIHISNTITTSFINVYNQLEEGQQTDCVLSINGVKIRCHTVILAALSPLFRDILSQAGLDKEDTDTIIIFSELWGENDKLLQLLLTMMYTGQIVATDRSISRVKELLVALHLDLFCKEKTFNRSDEAISKIGELESLSIERSSVVETSSVSIKELSADEPDFTISPIYDDEEEDFANEGIVMDSGFYGICSLKEQQQQNEFQIHELIFEFSCQDGEVYCSKACSGKCGEVFNTFKDFEKIRLQTMFSSERTIDTKSKLLSHLISQQDCGLSCDSYQINSHSFCLGFLSKETGISLFLLRSVLTDFWKGVKMYSHGNKGVIRSKAPTSMFIAWFKQFCATYGQSAPDEDVTVLSHWLNKKVLYDLYLEETVGPHLAQSTFYESFKNYFGPQRIDRSLPQVRISKYSSHSVCNICTILNNNKRQAKSEAELKVAQEKINNHRLVFGGARKKVDEIIQSALSFPADNLGKIFICIFFPNC